LRKPGIYILVVFVLLILLSFNNGCSCSSVSEAPQAPAADIVKLAIPSDLTASDPAMSSDVTSGQVLSKVFEKLVTLDDSLKIIPELAETFEVSADCTEFKFRLKSNVKFSDGVTVLNSKIVKDSFERVANPKTISPRANLFDKVVGYDEFIAGKANTISGITQPNDYEISIKIKQPFAPFLYNLTMVSASIAFLVNNQPIGSGPFVIASKSDGAKFILKKNPHYHNVQNVFIDEVIYKIVHDQMTQISEFELGNIDILNLNTVNVNKFLTNNPDKFNIHKQPKLNIYYIAFNMGKNIFSDNLRKAMNHAINKNEIINTLMKNTMVPARGPFPPALNAFDDSIADYKYDPAKAKELLAKEKPESLKFDLYYKSSTETEDLMQMIKEDLAKVGIIVTLKKMEWAALKSEIAKGNLSCYYVNWSADFPDAHNFLIPLFHTKNVGAGGNRAFFSDAQMDQLMDKLEATSDMTEYKKLAQKIQQEIVNKAPWVFLWHEIEFAASHKYIEGYNIPKIYSTENFLGLKIKR